MTVFWIRTLAILGALSAPHIHIWLIYLIYDLPLGLDSQRQMASIQAFFLTSLYLLFLGMFWDGLSKLGRDYVEPEKSYTDDPGPSN